MNESEKVVVPGQEHVERKESYEKPTVTTFGSVAKLTMSGGSVYADGRHTLQGHHHTKHHG